MGPPPVHRAGMRTAHTDDIPRLRREIIRLGMIVDAARMTGRDVSLQRALILQHAWALLALQLRDPDAQPLSPVRSGTGQSVS